MSTSYNIPDITGINTDYLQTNVPFQVYKTGMKIEFENSPIFSDSLSIILTDGTIRPFVKDTDWVINDEDIDETAMSRAYLQDANFNKRLLKSISIVTTRYVGQRVAMTFQEFYLTNPGRTFDDGRPFEVSVDWLKNLGTRVSSLSQMVARVGSPVVTSPSTPALLPLDVNKERNGNIITNEHVTVNTVAGNKIIRPAQGAFFADSLTVSFNGTLLNPNTDYLPIITSPLTKQSTNVGGIYQAIVLTKEIAGEVTLGYHAVGGAVQPDDIHAIFNLMAGIRDYLDASTFVTADTIGETIAFRAFSARLNNLEDGMRRLLTGTPTYGDSSSNNAVTRPISSPDADQHWWTIASLYKVEGSNDIIRADQFKGRVYLPGAKVAVSFTVDVNVDQTRQPATMTTNSLVFDPGYTLFQDLSVTAPQWPLLRVVYNNSSNSFSGIYLQIGIPLPSLQDLMIVEDFSSAESCWVMSRHNEFLTGQPAVSPSSSSDSGFVLPDGVSIWSPSSELSHSVVLVPDYREGYLTYSGSDVHLSTVLNQTNNEGLFSVTLPKNFPVASVKQLIVTVQSVDTNTLYDVVVPMTGTVDTVRSGRQNFTDSSLEALGLLAKLSLDVYGIPKLGLNTVELTAPFGGGNSTKSDIIRYVRVKV